MSMKVQCPSCHTELRVPENAGGRTARCPVCKHKFPVPRPEDLLEDVVSSWIVEDPDDRDDDDDDDDDKPAPKGVRPQPTKGPGEPTAKSGAGGSGLLGAGNAATPGVPGLPGLPGRPAAAGGGKPSGPAAPTPATRPSAASKPAGPAAPAKPGAANAPDAARPLTPVQPDAAVSTPIERPEVPAQPGATEDDDEISVVQRHDTPARRTDPPAGARGNSPHRLPAEPMPAIAAGPPRAPAIARVPAQASTDDTTEIDLTFAPTEQDDALGPSGKTAQMISPVAASAPPDESKPAAQAAAPSAPASPAPAKPVSEQTGPAPVAAPAAAPAEVPAFPTALKLDAPVPRLVVLSCNQAGVTLAFDAAFLEHAGFRQTMPQRCALTGKADKAELIARPMVFGDRAVGPARSAREIESQHEVHLVLTQASADVLKGMGMLETLPAPFNLPMPYYVAADHAQGSLQCTTQTRPDGGVTCRVLVPDGPTAIEWLVRVNGVWGPEHPMLEQAVARLWSPAWREIPEKVRLRIAAWCAFEPMESFRLYLPDAEFSRDDAGLAGVVLTDRRLVYNKFNHRGHVTLAGAGTLNVQPEGDFATLQLQTPDLKANVGKIHLADLPKLIRALGESKGLVLRMGGPG